MGRHVAAAARRATAPLTAPPAAPRSPLAAAHKTALVCVQHSLARPSSSASICPTAAPRNLAAQSPSLTAPTALTSSSASICASCAFFDAGSLGVMGRWRNGTPNRLATTSKSAGRGGCQLPSVHGREQQVAEGHALRLGRHLRVCRRGAGDGRRWGGWQGVGQGRQAPCAAPTKRRPNSRCDAAASRITGRAAPGWLEMTARDGAAPPLFTPLCMKAGIRLAASPARTRVVGDDGDGAASLYTPFCKSSRLRPS